MKLTTAPSNCRPDPRRTPPRAPCEEERDGEEGERDGEEGERDGEEGMRVGKKRVRNGEE